MPVFNTSPLAPYVIVLPSHPTVGDDNGQNKNLITTYPPESRHLDESGGKMPPNHMNGAASVPDSSTLNTSSTSPPASPPDASTPPLLPSSSSSSKASQTRQRHEFCPVLGGVSDEEANGYLERLGHNHYLCRWALCPQHLLPSDCQEGCQLLYCYKELHNSKENARVHVRQAHYGTADRFSCTACVNKTFRRKADAKRHCKIMNGRQE